LSLISDDLIVKPAVTSVSSSLLMKLGVVDANTIEESTLDIGVDEVIEYAKFLFECRIGWLFSDP
jgi:hypothetical protein